MFKVLTIAREYGSGGAVIGRRISERLGWKLLDKAFIDNVAHAAKVDPQLARRFDERTDSWLQRLAHQGAGRWRGAFEGAVIVSQPEFFDAETMAALAQNMIEEACQRGNCVIVGRGAQCVLQGRKNVFHVFIYAPWAERVARVQQRLPGTRDIEGLIRFDGSPACRLHPDLLWVQLDGPAPIPFNDLLRTRRRPGGINYR